MHELVHPPVKWNPFRSRGTDSRASLPPRVVDKSVLQVHMDTLNGSTDSVIKLMVRHPQYSFIIVSADPRVVRDKVVELASAEDQTVEHILYGTEVSTQQDVDDRLGLLDDIADSAVVLVTAPTEHITLDLHDHPTVGWVILEGPRGESARPCHPSWITSIRDQCVFEGVAFRFEGWGDWVENILHVDGNTHTLHVPKEVTRGHTAVHVSGVEAFNTRNPFDPFDPSNATINGVYGVDAGWTLMRRVGFRDAGRAIDGHEYDEAPVRDPSLKHPLV